MDTIQPEIPDTKTPLHILIVEDSEDDALLLVRALEKDNHRVTHQRVETEQGMREALQQQSWDVIIADYQMPDFDGLQALKIYQEFELDIPFIVVSDAIEEKSAVHAMRAGAHDCLIKGNLVRLSPVICRELQETRIRRERREALKKLRRSEARYRAILESQTELINRFTLDGTITYVNVPYASFRAKSPEEIIGLKHADFLPANEAARIAKVFAELTPENPKSTKEVRHRLSDGREIWIQWSNRLILDENGRPMEYQGVGRDITAQKQTETELRNAVVRLEHRAVQLQVAAEVAKDATSVRNLGDLLNRAVNLARDRFDFYHVAVFLLDETGEYAVLTAASGEAGKKLIQQGHKLKVGEEGIVGYVATVAKPHIAPDVGADAVHYAQPLLPDTQSEVAVPLRVETRVIGVLDVQSEKPDVFDDDDILILQTMADQLAIAIDNLRLLDDVRQRAEEMEGLYRAALATSRELEVDALLHQLYEQVQKLIAPDAFAVSFYNADEDQIHTVMAVENGKPVPAFQGLQFSPQGGGLTGYIIQTGRSLLLYDSENEDLPVEPLRDPHETVPTRSWLGVPLIARDKIIGAISIQSYQKGLFTHRHQRFLESLAAQAAIAFENAHLFESEREAREQAETLSEIARVINSSLDLNQVLTHIIEQIRRLIFFNTASVVLLESKQDVWLVSGFGYNNENKVRRFAGALLKDSKVLISMAETLQPVIIPDVRHHPDWIWVPGAEHVRSFLGVPILDQGKMIGALMLDRTQVDAFTEQDAQILQSVVQHLAIAVKNAHLFQQALTERQRITTLYELGQGIAASLHPKTILQAALALTSKALDASAGVAWLYLPHKQRLAPESFWQQGKAQPAEQVAEIGPSDGPIGRIINHREPVNFASVNAIERWVPYQGNAELQSMLAAPILEGEDLLGVIVVLHTETAAFDRDHLDLLQTICQQVGLALSNARRYQDVDRLAKLLSVERSRLEGLLEMLPVGVLLLDEQYNLLASNPLGREFLSDLAPQAKPEQPLSQLGEHEISHLLEHRSNPLPLEIVLEQPKRRVFEVQAQPIPTESPQWVITLRDVTQERDIQARIQMQERLATVGQLAAGIAHDFNNIMAAIVVYADLLLMDKQLSTTSRKRLVIIQQQVQRAASLIRQILDFSRRSVMEQNVFDLLPFLKEMEKLLDRTLPETITISLHYQEGEYAILADPTRLQQVFMNLAVNARDAMPEGGELRFDLEHLDLKPGDAPLSPDMPPGRWVRIRISDTGIGIPPDVQPHIFEPFFTTKPVGKGTGLGLAQVYGIIKQHEGFIDCESQPGEGTTFNIYLPDHSEVDGQTPSVMHVVEMNGYGKTVLLVEDDAATRQALQAMLTTHHYQVLIAQNGREALALLENKTLHIDLIISDIVMPEVGGIELYEQVQPRWPQVQFLFITGHPMEDRNLQMLQQGKIHWLQKPFTVREFNQVVRELLE